MICNVGVITRRRGGALLDYLITGLLDYCQLLLVQHPHGGHMGGSAHIMTQRSIPEENTKSDAPPATGPHGCPGRGSNINHRRKLGDVPVARVPRFLNGRLLFLFYAGPCGSTAKIETV